MFYEPVLTARWFKPGVRYSDINWNSLPTIVSEFDDRIRQWYLNPAKCLQSISGDYAFPVMALACMLTDTLSQFYSGQPQSRRSTFIAFVRQQFPEFTQALTPPIDRPPGSNPATISDYAEALYFGFRCGILHEAHVTPYGAISGQGTLLDLHPAGVTRYQDGAHCPTITIDPKRFLDALEAFFVAYVSQLLNPDSAHDPLRTAFKTKFGLSFGIDITNAA
jgi:hypothetical protein